VLIGNPNVGKSVLFGLLTKRYVTVSNYPGTTVTITRGKADLDGTSVEVLDSPGINSLVPMSEDEQVTRDILLQAAPSAIVQVADAKNLRRALILTSQLAEMGLPFVLDLNMTDEAGELGLRIDRELLEEQLGVRVVRTVATRRKGFDDLRKALTGQKRSRFQVTFPPEVEAAITAMLPHLPQTHVSQRAVAIAVLAGDETLDDWLRAQGGEAALQKLHAIRQATEQQLREPLTVALNRARFQKVDALLRQVESRPAHRVGSWLDRIGHWSMHPAWGIPVLLVVLYAMYQFVGVFGAGTLVDLLESKFFGEFVSPWAMRAADAVLRFPHQH
jgi:ferrous iron transport protein B